MPVRLERASAEDAETIYRMQQGLASRTYVPMQRVAIESVIREDVACLILAEDGVAAGFVIYKNGPGHVLLDEFGVTAEFRGRGVGTAALAIMLERVGACRVELMTHPENPAARLYGRAGFCEVGRVENFYGDGEPRMRMARDPQ
jgi:ribosomal protein S18 acetylase RimI-like enzyme